MNPMRPINPMRTINRRTALLSVCAAALLPGCAQYYYGSEAEDLALTLPRLGLIESSQQALDALLQTVRIDPRRSILVATLVSVDRLDQSSRFGRVVSEQLAGRVVQRGLTVAEVRLREQLALTPGQGELLLSRQLHEVSQAHQAQAVIIGTYAPSPKQVYISLKLVLPDGNTVIAAHDYSVAMDKEVRGLLQGRY